MAKKVIKVEDKKEDKKNNLDLGKITKTIMENGEAIGKIADGIGDLLDGNASNKTKTNKAKTSKKKSSSDSMSTVIDLAGTLLKK